MNWCYVTHGAIKLGVHNNIPSSNGSGIYVIGPKQTLTIHVSYMKKWPKCPESPLLLQGLFPLSLHYGLWGTPYNQLTEEEKTLVWFTDGSRQHLKVASCSTTVPFWDIPEGQWQRQILPVGNFKWYIQLFTLLRRKNGAIIYQFIGCDQWFASMVREWEGTWVKNWWQGNLGKMYVDRPLWMGK